MTFGGRAATPRDGQRQSPPLQVAHDGEIAGSIGLSQVVQLAEVAAREPGTFQGATTMLRRSLLPPAR